MWTCPIRCYQGLWFGRRFESHQRHEGINKSQRHDRFESNVNLDIANSFPLDSFTWTSGHFTPANSVTPIVNLNHDWNPNPVNDPVLAYSSYYSPDDINTHTTTNDAVTTTEPSFATVDPSELLPDSTPGASFNSTDDIPDPAVNTIEPFRQAHAISASHTQRSSPTTSALPS